jgi:hypothetical protein
VRRVGRKHHWLFAVTTVAALALAACGSEAEPEPTATVPPISTEPVLAAATEAPSVLPTPRPTSTPFPVPTEPPSSGGVTTSLNVLCSVGERGLELRVRYGSLIRDTDEPAATITRVRVYVDGALVEDSGPLSHRIFVREAFFRGRASRLHTIQLTIYTWAAPQPRPIVQFAQCPREPDGPFG